MSGRANVLDGDTVHVDGTRIRLHGIDAPETRQTCSVKQRSYACGEYATRKLRELIQNKIIRCSVSGHDKYGRAIATCRYQDINLNEWMVREGLALAYRRYSREYIAAETYAIENNKGIHRGTFIPPWEWRKRQRRSS